MSEHRWGEAGTTMAQITVELAFDVHASARARRFIHQHRDGLPDELVQDAQLVVTELVTNAIRYGRPALQLTLRVGPSTLSGCVRDAGADVPVIARDVPTTQPSGLGLLIVDALAAQCGVSSVARCPAQQCGSR